MAHRDDRCADEGRGGVAGGRTAARLRAAVPLIETHAGRIALTAIALNFAIGAAYALRLGGTLRYDDEEDYLLFAQGLANGDGYVREGGPSAYRPPAWPVFLALLRVLGLSVTSIRVVNVLLLSATLALVFLLARRLAGDLAAVLAVCAAAAYPLFLYTATTLFPQTASTLLLVAGLLLFVRAAAAHGRARLVQAAVGGLAFGGLVLSNPQLWPSVAAALGVLFLKSRRSVPVVAVALVAALALPVAWGYRNHERLGVWVFASTNGGVNLLLGNSEHAHAGGGRTTDISRYEVPAVASGLDEVERDRHYRDAALDWIRAHKGEALRLYLGKVANHFSFRNTLATSGQSGVLTHLALGLSYLPVLGVFVVGAVLCVRRRPEAWRVLLVGLVVGNAFVFAIFFTRIRFRVPLDALMIVLAAGFVADLLQRRFLDRPERPEAP